MIFPMTWYLSYIASDRSLKDFGVKVDKAGMMINKGKRIDFLYPLKDVLELQDNILKKIIEDKGYLLNYQKEFEEKGIKFLDFISEKEKIDTSKLSNNELFELYIEYNSIFRDLNYPVIVFIHFVERLAEEIKKFVLDVDDFEIFTKLDRMPYILDYELDILVNSENSAEDLLKKWYWIPFDYYGGEEWDLDHFIKELQKDKDLKRKNYLENYSINIHKDQEKVYAKYDFSDEEKHLIDCLQIINFLQDERKRVTNISYPFLQNKILAEISQRTDVSRELLWLMTPNEIVSALKGKIVNIDHRKNNCAISVSGDEFVVYEKIPDFLDEGIEEVVDVDMVKGVAGSKGIVKGKVRICKTSRDARLIENGEVMVAPCTTPDFIIGFQKAAAVVTDEGGVTSHAAVVSREMNLPCVIDTKNATDILRDGDYIEVDGGKGIVRIVEGE
jgi:phosphohistidine swiveling domain-containing protein